MSDYLTTITMPRSVLEKIHKLRAILQIESGGKGWRKSLWRIVDWGIDLVEQEIQNGRGLNGPYGRG